MARACKECGAAIPWGAPQCVGCGSYTLWRSRLATFGIVVGGGTVVVVILSLARVWFFNPPEPVRAAGEVQRFLNQVAGSEFRRFVGGAGRCKAEIAEALCVQTTPELESLDPSAQAEAKAALTATWRTLARSNPAQLVFVDSKGNVQPAIPSD